MILSLLKYFRGYLKVSLEGYAPERFLNLCSGRGILIWDLEYVKDHYEFHISVQGFFQLKPVLRKTKTHIVVLERNGFPFFLHRYRKRKFSLAGVFLFCFFLWFVSGFIWKIEVEGNTGISDEQIVRFLEENGKGYGCKKSEINCEELESGLRSAFDNVIWTAIKIEGTKMAVSIQENIPESEAVLPEGAYDLVAAKDGIIKEIVTRAGIPQVKTGDAVKAGDLLVSGRLELVNDAGEVYSYEYVCADADIMAETVCTYHETISQNYRKKILTGRTAEKKSVRLNQYVIPFYLKKPEFENCDRYVAEYPLKLVGDFYLPVVFTVEKYVEYEPEMKKYTEEEAKILAERNFFAYIENLEQKKIQIIEKNVKMELTEGTYQIDGTLRTLESIKEYAPAELLEIPTEGTDTDEPDGNDT